MGKPKRPIYVFKDGDFLIKCESMLSAARLTKESTGCINDIVRNPHWSRKGFFYSYKELRPDELPDFDEKAIKVIPRGFKTYKFDDDGIDCYIPPKKEKVKEDLRQFIYAHLNNHWKNVPKVVSKMERHYLEQLLDALILIPFVLISII